MTTRIWAMAAAMVISVPVLAQPADLASRVAAFSRINSAGSPSLSPDGQRLAYLSNASGSPQIWVKSLGDGSARQVTSLANPVSRVIWSPVADMLAYVVAPGGGLNEQIWVMRPDGSDAMQLTDGGKANNGLSGWTHDGRALMVNSNRLNPAARDPALIDVATGTWTMLASNQGLNSVTDVRGPRAILSRLRGRGALNEADVRDAGPLLRGAARKGARPGEAVALEARGAHHLDGIADAQPVQVLRHGPPLVHAEH